MVNPLVTVGVQLIFPPPPFYERPPAWMWPFFLISISIPLWLGFNGAKTKKFGLMEIMMACVILSFIQLLMFLVAVYVLESFESYSLSYVLTYSTLNFAISLIPNVILSLLGTFIAKKLK
jgi:heme/copper-type cytochrome/quinol oxidase subunit 4